MSLINLFKIAIKAILNNKARSFLSMLGIIIGVGAVIVMMAIGQGSKQSIREEIQKNGTNMLTIRPVPTCAEACAWTPQPCRHSSKPTTKPSSTRPSS